MKKNNRIWIYSLVVIGAFLMLAGSCKKSDNNPDGGTSSGTVKDIDGNVYRTVTIGTQVWMVENLNTTKYNDGSPIPNVTDNKEWGNLANGGEAYCNYNNDAATSTKYGKLYNRWAVYRGIAPKGWHVPSFAEFTTLENFVSANLGTSGSVVKALTSKTDWDFSNNAGAVGNDLTKNNTSGFTALPGGFRDSYGSFYSIRAYGIFWTTSINNDWNQAFNSNDNFIYSYSAGEVFGFSVRCIKD